MKYAVIMEVTYRKVETVESISKPYAEREAKNVIYEKDCETEIIKNIDVLDIKEMI
jgi:hypothetical protein